MHALLYVCLPRAEARDSLQARKKVCNYLIEEGFDTQLRFSGKCDYFKVGGRWSGDLTLLRLNREQPSKARRFWRLYANADSCADVATAFKTCFPAMRGPAPYAREKVPFYGYPDDAQVMDAPLFSQLRKGFSEEVEVPIATDKPNVIFTTDCYVQDPDGDYPWPKTAEESAKFWVVVIDYHF